MLPRLLNAVPRSVITVTLRDLGMPALYTRSSCLRLGKAADRSHLAAASVTCLQALRSELFWMVDKKHVFHFLDDLRNNATCFARRIAALSDLRPAPASWTRSTDLPAGSEGSSRSGVIARRFKNRRCNLEILSVSQRRLAA